MRVAVREGAAGLAVEVLAGILVQVVATAMVPADAGINLQFSLNPPLFEPFFGDFESLFVKGRL